MVTSCEKTYASIGYNDIDDYVCKHDNIGKYGITEFITEIDIWNRSSFAWQPIYHYLSYANGSEMTNNRNLFR